MFLKVFFGKGNEINGTHMLPDWCGVLSQNAYRFRELGEIPLGSIYPQAGEGVDCGYILEYFWFSRLLKHPALGMLPC